MRITNTAQFGNLIRSARKKVNLTQSDLAAASGMGEPFIRELEQGKSTCQIEKALFVMQMLGIKLEAVLPPEIDETGHE